MGRIKFGIQNGLNVARAGYTEDQIITACTLADRTGYDSVWYMDHTNVPQWKKAIVLILFSFVSIYMYSIYYNSLCIRNLYIVMVLFIL